MPDIADIPSSCDVHRDGDYLGSIGEPNPVHGYRCGCAWAIRRGYVLPAWHRKVFRDERPMASILRGGRGV